MSGYHFSAQELTEIDDRVGTLRRVRTDAPWGDDIQIMIPNEPPREGYVVEAMHASGGMLAAFWPVGDKEWADSTGTPTGGEPSQIWSEVVADAIDNGWQLMLRKQGGG